MFFLNIAYERHMGIFPPQNVNGYDLLMSIDIYVIVENISCLMAPRRRPSESFYIFSKRRKQNIQFRSENCELLLSLFYIHAGNIKIIGYRFSS